MSKLVPILSIDNSGTPTTKTPFTFTGVFVPDHVKGTRDHLFGVLYDVADLKNMIDLTSAQISAISVVNHIWKVSFPNYKLTVSHTYVLLVYTGKVHKPGPSATWTFKVLT